MFEKGTVVNGRYEVKEFIGSGGTSEVYLVSDRHIGRPLAMKVMSREKFGAARFAKSEIESLRCVHYPLFPDIHDAFCDSTYIYIVSDYVKGVSLRKMCLGNGLPKSRCLLFAARICEALAYLHGMKRPMLYLDLKPDNIIITDDGLPHLIDFGIASWLAGRHMPVGTPGYSPPEQHLPDGRMDETSDIYAFGMTYYCMRHGVPPDPDPYAALDSIRHSKVLSLSERSLLTKCCAISKDDRYKTVTEVLRQISYIRSIPYRLKKRTAGFAIAAGVLISSVFAGRAVIGRIEQKESAAKLVEAATKYMEDGHYTPEGIGIIKACINSGNLSDECEQEFIFEVAVDSMLISKDYRTAAAYFGRLDRDKYPEADDYERLCLLQSGFDLDPDEALELTGKLFSRIVQRSPSKMKYENLIFLAGCFENYEPDRRAGINKALSVLKIARAEISGLEEKAEYSDLQRRIDDLIAVKEMRLNIYKKGDNNEKI